jgi:hypothetical protein
VRADTLNCEEVIVRLCMHEKKKQTERKPAASQKERAEKFQWTEVAPVDLDRYARRAGEIIAQGASRRTLKKPRRRR